MTTTTLSKSASKIMENLRENSNTTPQNRIESSDKPEKEGIEISLILLERLEKSLKK